MEMNVKFSNGYRISESGRGGGGGTESGRGVLLNT